MNLLDNELIIFEVQILLGLLIIATIIKFIIVGLITLFVGSE